VRDFRRFSLSYLGYLLVTSLLVLLYLSISHQWVYYGGTSSGNKVFEYPIILIWLTIAYFPTLHQNGLKYFLPLTPIFILYVACDVFFHFFKRFPVPSDLGNISEVFAFSPVMALGIGFFLMLAPLSILLLFWAGYKSKRQKKKEAILPLAVRLTMLGLIMLFLRSDLFGQYMETHFNYIGWKPIASVRKNGRFGSFVFFQHKEAKYSRLLDIPLEDEIDVGMTLFPGEALMPRNIHLIVLESFIDPRLLSDISFNRSPLSEELRPFLLKKDSFSTVISPVYGGASAEATFELLTGVRAYYRVGSDYNVMRGYPADSFPNKLRKNGYRVMGTVASSSKFYNEPAAYKSLGFDDMTFLGDGGFRKRSGDSYIFDGDLLEHNLQAVKSRLKEDAFPLFNYVVGMYGHLPYGRNTQERPTIIETGEKDGPIHRIANQFYYRTKALGIYIKNLLELDPKSIIYVTSDHLPPVIDNADLYRFDHKVNISLLLVDEKSVDVSGRRYYQIPWLLWDLLSEQHERIIPDNVMEQMYFKLLAESRTSPIK